MHVYTDLFRYGKPPLIQDHGETSYQQDVGLEGSRLVQSVPVVHGANVEHGHAAFAGDGGPRTGDEDWNLFTQGLEASGRGSRVVDPEAANFDTCLKQGFQDYAGEGALASQHQNLEARLIG